MVETNEYYKVQRRMANASADELWEYEIETKSKDYAFDYIHNKTTTQLNVFYNYRVVQVIEISEVITE